MKYIENQWTTKQLFEYFDIDPYSTFGSSGQFHATHMIFKKNKNLKLILRQFDELINYDPYLISDKYSKENQIQNLKKTDMIKAFLVYLVRFMDVLKFQETRLVFRNIR